MKYYSCDMCGARIEQNELRYVIKMSMFAAYDAMQIELSDLDKDYEEEIHRLIKKMEHMDPKQLEEDVHKQFVFDVCRRCQQHILKNPLGSRSKVSDLPEELPPFDVDDFLRQFGSG